jgi:hypothetical protein
MAGESAPGRFAQLKSMNLRQDDCLGGWVGLHHDSRSIIMAGESAPGRFAQLKSMNLRQNHQHFFKCYSILTFSKEKQIFKLSQF